MNIVIVVDPAVKNQRQIINLPFGDKTRRVIFEAKYLDAPDKWFISLYNAQDGEPICTYVPVVTSKEVLVNLLAPYWHKNIGWLVCVSIVDNPSSENPSKDNMGEFGFMWGESYGSS